MLTVLHRICTPISLLGILSCLPFLWRMNYCKGSLPQALRVYADYLWVCQTSRTMQPTTYIVSIWAHCLSLWDLECNRINFPHAVRFKMPSLIHFLIIYGVVAGSPLTILYEVEILPWNAHSQKQSKTLSHKHPKNPKLHHYPQSIYVLKRGEKDCKETEETGRLPWFQS